MNKKVVIVGLRVTDPLPGGGFGCDCLPGYFCHATSNHRNGFQLPGMPADWFAFSTDPFAAVRFDSEGEGMTHLLLLIQNDPGRWKPLTFMTIFE